MASIGIKLRIAGLSMKTINTAKGSFQVITLGPILLFELGNQGDSNSTILNLMPMEHEEWLPQIIDDPKLSGLILEGGHKLPLKYTRQRDEVVTWLLFDTGARVSEVTGLMLGDWATLGTHTKARAFNKGSYGRRIKTLSFYDDTAILLKRYFDEERIRFDPHGYQLEDYLLLSKRKQVDLQSIPLFLTVRATQLTPKDYREHYWNPACQAADIEADVHQSRHWHVTREVRDIYETAKSKEEIERRLRGIIEYMKWKNEETLAAYQHYFDEQQNADLVNSSTSVCIRKFNMHGMVFQTSEGTPVILKAHLLRHTFATYAVQIEGLPLELVAEWLNRRIWM